MSNEERAVPAHCFLGVGLIREATAADAPAIARVHVESWRTTYRGIVPDDALANLSIERRERFWAGTLSNPDGPGFAYVAADDAGTVVGFASGGPEREGDLVYTGELYAIYLLAEQQGQGIGGQMMRIVAERLAAMGHGTMLVWVLAANPARHFYAALGGVPVREKQITMGGMPLTEVAYGWSDTRSIWQRG
ncbi:MAG: GNAT family N-acetyltransferase [Thermomicrobiales bacterium]